MKFKKFLTGMTVGIMAVSSAIVCQVSAGAVEATLISDAAVEKWKSITVDFGKAGIAAENSSLVISCPAPEGAVDGQRLFKPILSEDDWGDEPKYIVSYDSSKTAFSITIPGSELVGKQSLIIQACDVGVSLTVKAVDFAEDTRETVSAPELPVNIRLEAYQDSSWLSGSNAANWIELTDILDAETIGDLFKKYKSITIPAGEYFSDTLGLGADGFEYVLEYNATDGNNEVQYAGVYDSVSYADGGSFSLNRPEYSGSDSDKLNSVALCLRTKLEDAENGMSRAVSEKVRNLKAGDAITIQTREDKRTTAEISLDLPTNIRMGAYTDENIIGATASYEIKVTDQFNVKTFGDLVDTFREAKLPAGKYIGDSLGLGADGFEMNIGFMGRDAGGNEFWGCTINAISYKDGGVLSLDSSDLYYPGSRDDSIALIHVSIRPRTEYVESEGKNQAVSEKVRNLTDGTVITIRTAEDTRSEITVPAPTGGIVMYCYRDEWNDGTMANADIPASSVSGITIGKTTVKELKQTVKAISSSGKPVYTKDSLNLGKDAFSYAVWLHMKNGEQEEWWRGELVSFDEIATADTENIDAEFDDYVIEEIGLTVFPVIKTLPDGRSQAVSKIIRNLDPEKTDKIFINDMEAADDDEDDIKYDGLGDIKAEGTTVFKMSEWDPEQLDINVVGIDPSWIRTEDDVIIVKVKYNKNYYDEYSKLVIAKNDGDYSEGFAYQFGERDFNIHVRVGELMKYWNCKTVKELADKNMTVQLWAPKEGDSVNYQVSVISPVFEEKIEAPADKPEDYVPPAVKPETDKTTAQTTGLKPGTGNPDEKVYDTRFVMSVSSSDLVSGKGLRLVAYITIKRLDTNQTATISTTICYDSISAVGDTISADDGQKLLAFAILNIPAGVDIEYTSIILSVAEV